MPRDIIVGINIHNPGYTPYTNTLSRNLDDCAEMGMKIIRYNSASNDDETLKYVKYVADECHKRGMKILLCVDNGGWINRGDKTLEELEKYYEEYFEKISATLKDNIDIYQVFNETDVACMGGDILNITVPGNDGLEKGEYDCVRWDNAIYGMRGALRGLKKGYADACTSMNFCWWHIALIFAMYDAGCRWDVVGLDWYSDAEEVSSIDLILRAASRHIPDSDFMICETNQWMNFHHRWDEEKCAAIATRDVRNAMQAEWAPAFIQKLYDIDFPRFKGVIFYELLDEPGFERQAGKYNGESHFGFIECDERGENRVKKPVFETVKKKIKELGL